MRSIKMASFRVLGAFCFVLLSCANGQGITPIMRTVGKAQCVKNSVANTLTTRFVTKLNGDDINHVYGMRFISAAAGFESKVCTHEVINSVDENNQPAKYLTVTSTLNLATLTDAAATNPCGFLTMTDATKGRGFTYRVALRKTANFQYDIDRDYQWTCYESEALPTFVTAVLAISDPSVVELTVQNPTVSLAALRQVGNDFISATSCTVGEDMKLLLRMDNSGTYQSFIMPWGLYSYNTKVARSSADITAQQNTNDLINSGGCPVTPNVLELAGGFTRRSDSTTTTSYYESGVFQCKRYLDSNQLHFSTLFQFCFGVSGQDTRCTDFCAYTAAQAVGRRRRQASNTTDHVDLDLTTVLVLEVEDARDSDTTTYSDDENLNSKSVMIIVAVVGAVVLIAVVVVAICAVMAAKRRVNKDDQDTSSLPSSRASLERKLPVL